MTPPSLIQQLATPPPAHHEELIDFLHSLGGPVSFRISGRDPRRTRALLTLMHGNEPSGLWAIWQMLKSGFTPEFDLLCVILSHEAASTEPPFTHRTIPGKRDLNRCFYPPFTGYNGKLAAELLELLNIPNLEAIVDMHNTSGEGPA